jgi:hypothetical protein
MKTITVGSLRKGKYRRSTKAGGVKAALNLNRILRALAKKRPIFHSEADFQRALAWEIQAADPTASIRLELPVPGDADRGRIYLDLLVKSRRQRCAIELKYKTAGMTADVRDERFSLANQGAPDIGRYDFLKDVTRLERYVASTKNSIGYAILLTNDEKYWNEADPNTTSAEFSIHHAREIRPDIEMRWALHTGFVGGREQGILLESSYACSWANYSTVAGRQFRYLLLKVAQPAGHLRASIDKRVILEQRRLAYSQSVADKPPPSAMVVQCVGLFRREPPISSDQSHPPQQGGNAVGDHDERQDDDFDFGPIDAGRLRLGRPAGRVRAIGKAAHK